MSRPQFKDRCCNPFKEKSHGSKKHKTNLRKLSKSNQEKLRFLEQSDILCQPCRKKIDRMSAEEIRSMNKTSDLESNVGVFAYLDNVIVADDNEDETDDSFSFFDSESEDELEHTRNLIAELKEKLHNTHERDEKIRVLTVLETKLSVRKTAEIMNTSRYLIKKARDLRVKSGILSTVNKKPGKIITADIENKVKEFYELDDVSSPMPGQGDTKSVKIDGNKVMLRKRLIMGNLKDVFVKFRNENPDVKIGLSRFCSLRPTHCILAGSGGTHIVCVCPIHENMQLMAKGSRIVNLMKNDSHPISNYEDILLLLLCQNPTEECYFGKCQNCPKDNNLKSVMCEIFKKDQIQEIRFKQWISNPQTTLQSVTVPTEVFITDFCKSAQTFLYHSFIAKKQASCYKQIKKKLQSDQCLVVCDFAENYAFLIQNSVPGFHWNNNQATIFPIVFYYNDNGSIEHKTLVCISDCKKHDAVAVYLFLKEFNIFLSSFNAAIRHCIYFSDGAPQQFKNTKNFSTIYYHEQDFGRSATWHFQATAHGKGPCDGAGGAFKGKARKASLQMTAHITTARELYEWAQIDSQFSKISVIYKSEKDYEQMATFLEDRFNNCATISGTQKFHYVAPEQNYELRVKTFSLCTQSTVVSFQKKERKRFNKNKNTHRAK